MSNKDYAILNYYLTLLRGILLKKLDNVLCDSIREEYVKQIDNINEIMKFHILEGEEDE